MTCASCGRANPAGARFCCGCGTSLAPRCPACGAESAAADARFCVACGSSLVAGPKDAAGARKVVTIVFADLAGSTALHERLDAESTRAFMDRYYRAMRSAVEAHGGTVTQLLGDGVKAVFGAPRVAEDDALRAVRAAVAMQRAFRELVSDASAAVGPVGLRVAVNTGEVVAQDESEIIGDPVNVAARLQQEAQDGDVLVGESTQRLVGQLVTLAPFGTFALKGRAEPVSAYRVVSLERPAGAPAVAFVGRDDELRRLLAVYDAARAGPAARLAVILGSPGLGKSRLLDELGRRLGDRATLLTARCEATAGATFAPIAEALRALLGIEVGADRDSVRATIESTLPGDSGERARIADGVAALLSGAPALPEETFFVVRRFLAALATRQPVVLAIDDLHWAEPLLLDLTEHLVQWGAGIPLLVLAAARPELREARSSLATPGPLVADVVTLAGLDAGAATRLAANVVGADELPAAIAGRVLATSEGNPLFVGELVRMLVHDGVLKREGERWTTGVELSALEMPPTIHALLAARIERLRPEERTVLERAAVVGRQFSRQALAHLLPREITDLDARLEALRRSELVEPDTGWLLGEPVLRFHHVLIRDAAYRRLLKNTRAELHERFADWLEGRVGEAVEHDETLGWHLEQAHQHLRELGPVDARGRVLGERAARRLAAAGRRALASDDVPLAAGLLGRALDGLDRADPARADLALDWCEALLAAGEVGVASAAIDELGRVAGGSERLRAWHTCFAGELAALTDPKSLRATVDAVAAAAETLAGAGDAAGEAKAHWVHAQALSRLGQIGAGEAALDRALAAARRVRGDRRRANAVLAGAPLAALWGPGPVARASGRCLDVVRVLRITQGAPGVEAVALRCQAVLEALRGRSDAARRMIASSRRMVEELGLTQGLLETEVSAGFVALIEGDADAAEQSLRAAYEGLRQHGLGIDAARAAGLLGLTFLAQDRPAEAEALSFESEALAGDDLQAAITWRRVRAEALARRGEHAAAVELARAAVEIAAATDALLHHGDARLALAAALRAAGRDDEATAEEARAIELWEAKGATLLTERVRQGVVSAQQAQPTPAPRDEPVAPVRRRVRANAATALAARMEAAFSARNPDAFADLLADDLEAVHHPTGAIYGRQRSLRTLRSFLRADDLTWRHEPLATLGESLALCRCSISASGISAGEFDVGVYEGDELQLIETDAEGRRRRVEMFAEHRLGDAVARLYERYAELLPEGPERERAAATARSVAALLGPPDRWPFAPDVEATDHRTVGWGSLRGADAVVRSIRTLIQLSGEFDNRLDDVLDLRSDALLVRWTTSGTIRASGGAYERRLDELWTFGVDGLVTRWEQFDAEQDAEALARFDALTAEAVTVRRVPRRVRANAATASEAFLATAIAARDVDAIAAHGADLREVLDHRTGAIYDRQGWLAMWRSLLRAQDGTYRQEPLATLGDSLALCRQWVSARGVAGERFDVAAYEMEWFLVAEVDERGRPLRRESFAANHLGDAIVRLYERYAELLPVGPERTRAAATARTVAAVQGPLDPDRFATALAPDVEATDHRTVVGWGSLHGADEVVRAIRPLVQLTEEWAFRIDGVLGLRSDALLVRWTTSGTLRAGGGAFERLGHMLWILGGDGLVTRWEMFDAEQDAEALARFDELTAEPPAPRPVRRRVRPNAATANLARLDAAIASRDADALPALFAHEVQVVYRQYPGGVYDRQGALVGTWRSLLSAQAPTCRNEPLATLGDSLVLCRQSVSASGFTGRRFDVGTYEQELFALVEVDSNGRQHRVEFFAIDHLGDAVARLYQRYAELLPEGPERTRAAAIARSLAAMLGPLDLDRFATAYAPAIEYVDHRTLGTFSGYGAEALLEALRSWLELGVDLATSFDDVLDLQSGALLARRNLFGTDRATGGAFERPSIHLHVFGSDGLMTRFEQFDPDREVEALARFDDLAAEPPRLIHGRLRENAATAHVARLDAAVAARDADAIAMLFAEDYEAIDHPTGARWGRSGHLDYYRRQLRVQDLARRTKPLATLGDSLVVCHYSVSGSAAVGRTFDIGAFDSESHILIEVDANGRGRRSEVFAADQLGDAIVRLYERYAELLPDGPERERAAATARSVAAFVGPFDLDRFAAALAPEVESVDHRTLGTWSARGKEALLEHFRAAIELTEDAALRDDDVLGLRPGACLVRRTHLGTDRATGGSYERPYLLLQVFGADGLASRWEHFDTDREAEALARFDELAAEAPAPRSVVRRVRPNAATTNVDRVSAAIAARDARALPSLIVDDAEVVHHPTRSAFDGREEWRALKRLLESRDGRLASESLATLGDSLALVRQCVSASGGARGEFDVGAWEIESIRLVEVDANGRRRRTEVFAADHLGDAVVRLHERYAELLPDGSARARVSATARAVAAVQVIDLDRYGAAIDPAIEFVDHRPLGFPATTGAEAYLRRLGSLTEVADDVTNRIDDVLGLRSDALLVRWTNSGTDRSSGGAFERPFVILWIFGADGLVARNEMFDADHADAALARFDALAAGPPRPVRSRLRANAATAHVARLEAAVAARDADAIAMLLAEDYEAIDHPTGARYGRSGQLDYYRRQLRVRDLVRRTEPLATLGDSLALCRQSVSGSGAAGRTFDVGPFEFDNVVLVEADMEGRRRRLEIFAAEHFGDAIGRLYARYAELLPEGPERKRAAARARSVAAWVAPPDLGRWAGTLAPAVETADHRTPGLLGSAHGADAFVRTLRSIFELAADMTTRVDDVLGLRSDALLVRLTDSGTDRTTGGCYERRFIQLWLFGTDGLVTRDEIFDGDRDAEALARFDELVAESASATPARRRVRPNAASANAARLESAIAARDLDGVDLFADDMEAVHHPTGLTYDRSGALETYRGLLRAPDVMFSDELLATLGGSLALSRVSWSASGVSGGNFDVGTYEYEGVLLVEVDPRGRRRREELFGGDRLGDAVARLHERHAELLPDGPERARAAATARSVAVWVGPPDLDRWASVLAPAVETADHRTLGFEPTHGADAFLRGLRSLFELAADVAVRLDEILGLRSDALLVRWTNSGTDRGSGGPFERRFIGLWIFGTDGLTTRFESFDENRDAEALARFDELAAEPTTARFAAEPVGAPTKSERRVRPNAATANAVRVDAAIVARDVDAFSTLWADESEAVGHGTRTTWDRQGSLAAWRSMLRVRDAKSRHEPLATLGDSLALCRWSTSASGFVGRKFDVGAYEREEITLVEVDAQGRRRRTESFPVDRLGEAVARLYERYAELLPEGPERTRAGAAARWAARLAGPFDPDGYAIALAPAIEVVDHRMLGTFSARGAEALLQNLRAWLDLADDITHRLDEILGLRPDALLARWTHLGTLRAGGGAYERPYLMLSVLGADGQVSRWEFFDADRDAEALARFDELTAGPPAPRFANAATRTDDAFIRCQRARDWEGVVATFAPGARLIDRRSLTGRDLAGSDLLASLRVIFDMGFSRWRRELLATRGERLALFRYVVESEDATAGPAVVEYVGVVEVDARGLRECLVAFDPDDLDAAYAELDDRFAAGEGAPHAGLLANQRAFMQALAAGDDDTLRRLVPDDLTVTSHLRLVATEGPVGRDDWLASFRNASELGELLAHLRFDHIPRLSATAGVFVVTLHGTVGGGAFERPAVVVVAHDGSRPRSLEEFDLEQLDAAFARYEELSTRQTTARIENAATRMAWRALEAWQARDWERLSALFAAGFRHIDRRPLIRLELDRDEWLASYRQLVEITSGYAQEVLATRGERLGMVWVRWEGADRSIGPSEIESLAVLEVDGHGDAVVIVEFDPDDLDAAYAELDARYAAGEAAPYARTWAALQRFGRAVAARDWEQLASAFAPDFVVEDHRPPGLLSSLSRDDWVASFRALTDLRPDATLRTEHVLALDDRRFLAVRRWVGAELEGAFEIPIVISAECRADELRRFHLYDLDQLDAARACYDALGASPPRDPLAALARPNAATAAMDRVQAAFEARDWEAVRSLPAEGARFEDRRRHSLLSGDVDWLVANLKLEVYESGLGHFQRRLVATAGDRVCLHRGLWTGGGPGGGRAEIEYLHLAEVDESGRLVSGVVFDPEDWRAATREGWGRWLARDAAAAAIMRPIFELVEGANDHDRARMRAVFADDLVVHDHRLTGEGRVDGADAYLDTFAVVRHLVPDMQLEPRFVLALERHGVVAVSRLFGTLSEGGAFEIYVMDVATVARGRVTRLEFFEIEAPDAALARLAELRPDPLRIPPNAARRVMERYEELAAAGAWEALESLCAPTLVLDDRRRGLRMTGDRAMLLANSRLLHSTGLRPVFTPLATGGERLLLERGRYAGAARLEEIDGIQVEVEAEYLALTELDAEGRLAALIFFDPDDRRAASRELLERHARSEDGKVPAAALELWRAFLDRDLERCRAALPADFVFHDHRRSGVGRIEGADAWIAWNATLPEQSPDAIWEPLYSIASDEHGSLTMGHAFGTLAEGGEFESVFLSLMLYRGGRPVALERFEPEDLDLARARFEELRATRA